MLVGQWPPRFILSGKKNSLRSDRDPYYSVCKVECNTERLENCSPPFCTFALYQNFYSAVDHRLFEILDGLLRGSCYGGESWQNTGT